MVSQTLRGVEVTRLSPVLGGDVGGVDLAADLDRPGVFDAVRDAFLKYGVLRFRGQRLADEHLLSFSRRFGPLDKAPITTSGEFKEPRFSEVTVISNIVENGRALGSLGNYESEWHTDMSYIEETPSASVLYSLEVPEAGGDTSFASMYAAYDGLPANLKKAIEGKRCKHDASRNSAGELRKGFADPPTPIEAPGVWHPLVRTHPVTKRKALFLGRRRNAYVEGLPLDESEALLDELWKRAIRPEYCWTQKWKVGDVIMWDNRCVVHRRDAFDANTRRLMHRTQIKGDRPY